MAAASEVDVIVAGSGPAACALVADLLAAYPPGTLTIAVLERGPPPSACPEVQAPLLCFSLVMDPSKGVHRVVRSQQPPGRQSPVFLPVGNVLGGGSQVNFMHYSRGGASDYDCWPEGWKFKDLEPLFLKNESCGTVEDPAASHAKDGPIKITYGKAPLPMTSGFLDAATKVGLPYVYDLQDFKTSHGVTRAAKTVHPTTGRRSDAYTALLQPLESSRPQDLLVLPKCVVSRVLFDDDHRATGCEYVRDGKTHTIRARKLVVLAAGALGTPAILERSGVGDPKVLRAAGVTNTFVDLPGVGESLQDHQMLYIGYKAKAGTPTAGYSLRTSVEERETTLARFLGDPASEPALGTNNIDVIAKVRPAPDEYAKFGASDKAVQEILDPHPARSLYGLVAGELVLGLPTESLPPVPVFGIAAVLFHPFARGSLHITTTDPGDSGLADPRFAEHHADIAVLVDAARTLDAMARKTEFYDGPLEPLAPKSMEDQDLKDYIKETIGTTFHPIGTCAMKPRKEGGVVDERLNVYGTKGLKVADLSICPSNVSAHTYMTALAVGSRAAQIIIKDLKGASI